MIYRGRFVSDMLMGGSAGVFVYLAAFHRADAWGMCAWAAGALLVAATRDWP